MKKMRIFFLLTAAIASLLILSPTVIFGQDQDSPSLGDAARQARLQKQKGAPANDTANKDARDGDPNIKPVNGKAAQTPAAPKKTSKVVTNEEIPEHVSSAARPPVSKASYHQEDNAEPSFPATEEKAHALRAQIAIMKNYVASVQAQIDSLNDSIHFAPGNCVANCVQWNERQVQKQQQVEQMKAQLEDEKKHLEDMQESARQQGFGSSVYDP
jgi:hypothetical protein